VCVCKSTCQNLICR